MENHQTPPELDLLLQEEHVSNNVIYIMIKSIIIYFQIF